MYKRATKANYIVVVSIGIKKLLKIIYRQFRQLWQLTIIFRIFHYFVTNRITDR
jgi:hypothetical protein